MRQLLTALLFSMALQQAFAGKSVVICYDSWPPAKITHPATLKKNGFIVDMLRSIYEKHGYQVTTQEMPYMRAIAQVEKDNCDLEPATTLAISKVGLFPRMPSYVSQYVFFARKGSSFNYTGTASLKGLLLGNVLGYNYSSMDKDFQNYISAGGAGISTLTGPASVDRTFMQIAAGRVDLFAEDINVGK